MLRCVLYPINTEKNSVKPVSNWEKEILNTEFLPRLYELIFFFNVLDLNSNTVF